MGENGWGLTQHARVKNRPVLLVTVAVVLDPGGLDEEGAAQTQAQHASSHQHGEEFDWMVDDDARHGPAQAQQGAASQ